MQFFSRLRRVRRRTWIIVGAAIVVVGVGVGVVLLTPRGASAAGDPLARVDTLSLDADLGSLTSGSLGGGQDSSSFGGGGFPQGGPPSFD